MSSSKPYKLDQVGIRMVKEPPLYSAEPVNSPQAAVRLMSETLKGYDREVLAVVNLRNDLKPINMNIVSIGTLNQSLAHPREILKSIVLSNAGSVMLFHNHPSGNLTPSQEDISLTDRMSKICELLGTPIVDHIIIGNDDRYFSFRENSILKVPPLEYARDVTDLHLGAESVSEIPQLFFEQHNSHQHAEARCHACCRVSGMEEKSWQTGQTGRKGNQDHCPGTVQGENREGCD